jgi:hypothetical protein
MQSALRRRAILGFSLLAAAQPPLGPTRPTLSTFPVLNSSAVCRGAMGKRSTTAELALTRQQRLDGD